MQYGPKYFKEFLKLAEAAGLEANCDYEIQRKFKLDQFIKNKNRL